MSFLSSTSFRNLPLPTHWRTLNWRTSWYVAPQACFSHHKSQETADSFLTFPYPQSLPPPLTLAWNELLKFTSELKSLKTLYLFRSSRFFRFPQNYIFLLLPISASVTVKFSLVKCLQDGNLSFQLYVSTEYVKVPCAEQGRSKCRIPTDYQSS